MNKTKKRILGIIPARGGSKKVPKKNIKLLNGKPLIYYTINEAIKSKYIDRLILSTDDKEIASIGSKYGVEVPFIRPDKLSGDYVTDLPVFKHCLSWMNSNEGYCPDILVHLRPTAPMRTCENIDSAIKLLLNNPSMDSIRSVTKVSEHPMKMWKKNSDKLTPFITDLESGIKESYNMPRQKLPNVFIQNGSVDVIWARTILEKDSMSGEAIKPYIMDERNSINIDTELDFYLAEILIRNKSEN